MWKGMTNFRYFIQKDEAQNALINNNMNIKSALGEYLKV